MICITTQDTWERLAKQRVWKCNRCGFEIVGTLNETDPFGYGERLVYLAHRHIILVHEGTVTDTQ